MRVALVGSREWPLIDVIRQVVKSLDPHDIVVSGGARGADTMAKNLAEKRGLKTDIYIPDWDKYHVPGKKNPAGFIRNKEIVNNSDRVVAFVLVDENGEGTGGTMNTVSLARKAGKPVTIHKYNGRKVWVEECIHGTSS